MNDRGRQLQAALRANRALQAVIAIKRIPTNFPDEAALLAAVCRCIVETGAYHAAWIGFAGNGASGRVEIAASAGIKAEQLQKLELNWRASKRDACPVCRAICDGKAVAIDDIGVAPGLMSWRDFASAHSAVAVLALPLKAIAGAAGALVIFANEAGSFGESECEKLGELAQDIDRLASSLHPAATQNAVETSLAHSLHRMEAAERIARVGSWEWNPVDDRFEASAEFFHIFELDGQTAAAGFDRMLERIHPDDRGRVLSARQRALSDRAPFQSTYRLQCRDGRIKTVQQICEATPGEAGDPVKLWGTVQDITELSAAQFALQERAKETHCLHQVFKLTESADKPLQQLLDEVVAVLPAGWVHHSIAHARIRHRELIAATSGFIESAFMLTAVFNSGGARGEVSVAYPDLDAVPGGDLFLPEERTLLEAVAARIGEAIERRNLLQKLQDREGIFAAVFDQARESVALVDPDTGGFLEFNRAAHENLGYSRAEFAAMGLQAIEGPRDAAADPLERRRMREPGGLVFETTHRHRDGSLREVRVSIKPFDVNGRPCLSANWTDVTESNAAARELRRANRELKGIAEAMRAIVFAPDEQHMLENVCGSIIESGGYRMCWVGYAENDEARSVRAVAHAGMDEDYVKSIRVTWKDEELGRGPTGRAIRENRVVAARFIDTDPDYAPWREAARRHGYASSISLPLLGRSGGAGGALMVYSVAPDAFDDDEVHHLLNLANALSFGITALRDRIANEKAQAEVRIAADRLKRLLASSPVVLYSLNASAATSVVTSVSENLPRAMGYSTEEALAPGWWLEHLHPDDRAMAVVASARLIAAGGGVHDYRFARRDGTYVWVRDELRVDWRAEAGVTEVVGVWTDISQQRQAADEIRKLSAVIEQSLNSVIITDLEARIEYVNGAVVQISGFERDELIGRNPRLLQSGQTPDSTYAELWRELVAGRTWKGELRNRRKDGTLLIERAMIAPLKQPDGTTTHYVAIKEDITAQHEAEERLQTLALAVEQSPESIVITDISGCIEYVNEAFVRHSGYERDEVLGRNPRILHSGRTPKAVHDAMWQALSAGEAWSGEFINRRKDGSEFTELANVAPVRRPDGRITHYLAIKADITERKLMAEELEGYRQHLEELVKVRTVELADARERADAANLAKSAFLANMSHEIRTPMNAITGLTYLLLQSDLSSEQTLRLKRIEASSRHLLSLIDDILDLSKIEAGKMILERVAFDLRLTVDEAFELVGGRARDKGLSVRRELDERLPARVQGDPLRLRQVLLNLGSNAVKFTDHGSVMFYATVESQDGDQVRIRFEVRDTGIGIGGEQLDKLFLPFEQADTSTTRKYGGTGLGLAISRRLVEMMGGSIGVDSMHGIGSSFWFTLPFKMLAKDAIALEPVAPRVAAPGPGRPRRILLVEDDPINQEVAGELLAGAGHSVDIAANGVQALERAAAGEYDLILMDMQMPVMDGITATRKLREMAAHACTPIIAMTANAFAEDRERCIEAGMNGFISKPVEPSRLYEQIDSWTAAVRPTPAGPSPLPSGDTSGKAALRQQLAEVDGLDADAGLASVEGRWDSYQRVLGLYLTHHAADASRLRSLLTSGNLEDAKRVVHTLKGVATMLGAARIHSLAERLETALNAGADDRSLTPLLLDFHRDNEKFVAQLGKALAGPIKKLPHVPDWSLGEKVLGELENLLAEDDVGVGVLFRNNAALLEQLLGEDSAQIGRYIDHFDFEPALVLLRAAKGRIRASRSSH